MNTPIYQRNMKQHQRGAATLMISLILLFSITMITLYAARNNVTETQIAANDYRSKQAYETSQAGLEAVLASLYSLPNRTVIADSNGDGTIDNNGIPQQAVALANGSSYTVTYSNPVPGDTTLINISVIGSSIDDSASRTINQMVQILPFNLNAPNSGLVAGSNVQLGGSAQINNVASVANQATAVAGGNVIANGAGGTGQPQAGTCDGGAAGYTTSDPFADGVTRHDTTIQGLAADTDNFFSNFFGLSKTALKAMAYSVSCTNCQASDFAGMEGGIVWVDHDISLTGRGDIGSLDKPVLLIVDGNINMVGRNTIYGLVYSTSNDDNGSHGNSRIEGAVIVENNFAASGNYCINYNPNTASGPGQNSGPIAKVAGGWRDF